MKYEYKSSFDKTLKKLELERKIKVKETISQLIDFFETGRRARGLGLKHLKGSFWEVRIDIKDRIIFTLEKDMVSFIVTGNHDEIKRFLKLY